MRRLVTGHRRYTSVNRCAYASSSERLNVTTQNGRAGSNCPADGFSLATERGREGPKERGGGEQEKEEEEGGGEEEEEEGGGEEEEEEEKEEKLGEEERRRDGKKLQADG